MPVPLELSARPPFRSMERPCRVFPVFHIDVLNRKLRNCREISAQIAQDISSGLQEKKRRRSGLRRGFLSCKIGEIDKQDVSLIFLQFLTCPNGTDCRPVLPVYTGLCLSHEIIQALFIVQCKAKDLFILSQCLILLWIDLSDPCK